MAQNVKTAKSTEQTIQGRNFEPENVERHGVTIPAGSKIVEVREKGRFEWVWDADSGLEAEINGTRLQMSDDYEEPAPQGDFTEEDSKTWRPGKVISRPKTYSIENVSDKTPDYQGVENNNDRVRAISTIEVDYIPDYTPGEDDQEEDQETGDSFSTDLDKSSVAVLAALIGLAGVISWQI